MAEEKMIHLRGQDIIASSKTRNSYLHPSDSGKIIKIIRKSARARERDANRREWAHYLHLTRRYPGLDIIPVYHGFVETNLGEGLMIDCIRDHDGQVSKRLQQVLLDPGKYDLQAVGESLERLCGKIIAKNIQLFDLNMFNILIRILPNGEFQPVCVDIKGRYNNYEFIPVSTYIPFFSRMKLKRRCSRLIEAVRQALLENPAR